MKKLLFFLLFGLMCGQVVGSVTDVYRLTMTLQIPRIYDNMESLGYRKYQSQHLEGELRISYEENERPVVSITNLVNKTHKIAGDCITYDTSVDECFVVTRVNLIGNNKTDTFTTPSVVFYIDAEPSYNVGEDDEDNSLLGIMSGRGNTVKVDTYKGECVDCRCEEVETGSYRRISYIKGYFSGTLGCGCKAYGHVSPTRVAGAYGATDVVDDVAAVYGTWTARFKKRIED